MGKPPSLRGGTRNAGRGRGGARNPSRGGGRGSSSPNRRKDGNDVPMNMLSGGQRGNRGTSSSSPSPAPGAGRGSNRDPQPNANVDRGGNTQDQYDVVPQQRNHYDAPDSPLERGNPTSAPTNNGPSVQTNNTPANTNQNTQPIVYSGLGVAPAGIYGPGPAGVNNALPIQQPPNRASRLWQKIKPETKKGKAIYGTIALLFVGGAATSPLWVPAIIDAVDSNASNTPQADNGDVTGKRESKPGDGTLKQGFKDYDLKELVTPADSSDQSKIKASSFLLYSSLDISEQGAKEIVNKGTWKVSNQGILSYEPDNSLEFGTAQIVFTVEDESGRLSNQAIVNIQYGPLANTIEKANLAPDEKTAAINIINNVTPAAAGAEFEIDLSTLELVNRTVNSNGVMEDVIDTEITTLDGSIWKVENGTITFEPSDGFISTNVAIGYQVKDKAGAISNEGMVILNFKPESMTKPPVTDPNGGNKPMLGYMPDIAVNTENVTFQISTTVPLATSSVEISASMTGPFGNTVVVSGQGQWKTSGNSIVFERDPNFLNAPTTIYFRAKSDKNVFSDVHPLMLAIYPRPIATDDVYSGIRAVIDVLDNDRVVFALEDNKIAPETLEFFAVKPDDSNDPMPVIAPDGKSATVDGQGEWGITSKSHHVTFKPERNFKGVPSPIYYTFQDTKGSESNPARITINEADMSVRRMVADMVSLSQAEFWARFKNTLNGKPLDEVLVVSYQLRNLFLNMLSPAQLMDIRTAPGIPIAEQDRIFMAWMDADFSIGKLVDETDNVRQATLGLQVAGNNLGARVLRIEEVMRALDKFFAAFEEAL